MKPRSNNKLLIVNHFGLRTICGTTVMFGELLRIAPRTVGDVSFMYESHDAYPTPDELRTMLEASHRDASCVVSINGHIEVAWAHTEELFRWCRECGIPAYVYVHDYWPHHLESLRTLVRSSAYVAAATPFVAEQLRAEGFDPLLIPVGIAIPDAWPPPQPCTPKVIASVARLVPRKRLYDIVRAFGLSGADEAAQLYLRVAPSQVFDEDRDAEQLREIELEVARARLKSVTIDLRSGQRPDQRLDSTWYPDYGSYAAYICSSSYEGFGMPVVEAPFYGCPPLMSDIPPHRRSAQMLFGDRAREFLFEVGNHVQLAELMRDELFTRRRKKLIGERLQDIRSLIVAELSLQTTARALAELARPHGAAANRKPL